jgi:membrane fusion protein, copper/silver efflux system
MKRYVVGGILLILVICAFVAGSWFSRRDSSRDGSTGARRILYYVDPMNPAHTSDKPGIAPCGMKMEPVYADEGATGAATGSAPSSMPPGTVKVSPEKQQVIGVRLGRVEKASTKHVLRTTGRVTADETRIYRINAAVDGWIVESGPNRVGSLVKKDERLGSFYSPEFLSAQQAYLFALGSLDRFQSSGKETPAQIDLTRINVQQYVDSLRNLGMSQLQIKELARTRQFTENIYIVAPVTGFILARNISPGQRFEKGTEWYRIADLSRVYILADLFQGEAGDVKPGTRVRVTVPHQKKEYHAAVSKVLPQFDPNSRTLKVGLEAGNPDYALRPDMFVDVEFPVARPAALTVPVDAILDSGLKKTVFVDRGNGFFEPRQVETGWRLGDRVEITKGLMSGEHIVVSGNFLIDSESRMRLAAANMYGAAQEQQGVQRAKDPVCGAEVDAVQAKMAGRVSQYRGQTYYFHNEACKRQFDRDSTRFLKE